MGLCASNAVAAKPAPEPEAQDNSDDDPPVKQFGKKKNSRRDSIAYNKAAMEKREAAADPTARAPASMVEEVN
jgi:hypothetical protein